MKKGIYIKDSIHGLISLSEYEKRIISSIGFNRLHDVYQNSTVYLTFPSNRTKRFEHSIGTMKLCSDMFFHSILNANDEDLNKFYELFKKEIDQIIRNLNVDYIDQKLGQRPKKLPNIEIDKMRHSLIPHNVPEDYKIIHLILIESIRVAALLHDIGHPPFSHIVESALNSVYSKSKKNSANDSMEFYNNKMESYFGEENHKLHEEMGKEISKSILKEIIPNLHHDTDYKENLFETLVKECVNNIFNDEKPFSYLHNLIDSSLDGDRLDYVTRDSVNSGINSGKIDYSRIINDMKMIYKDENIYFCVPLKTINSIEDFIKRRYSIYKDIIYHHRVIKTDCLLEYTVETLIEKYLNSYKSNDNEEDLIIPYDISGLWFPLGKNLPVEKSTALSQWNDSWLMTILKQTYYTNYYEVDFEKDSPDFILKRRLDELLLNKKEYFSLIKRSEHFRLIDDSVRKKLTDEIFSAKITEQIKELNELSTKYYNDSSKHNNTKKQEIDITGSLRFIQNIVTKKDSTNTGFVLWSIYDNRDALKIENFIELIKKTIINVIERNQLTRNIICDIMIIFNNRSVGLDKLIYMYDNSDEIFTLNDISGISNMLILESHFLPLFYIYIMPQKQDILSGDDKNRLLISVGEAIGDTIIDRINDIILPQIKKMEELLCAK